MSDYIALIDPSIFNNLNVSSPNLGDIIIYDSVRKILKQLFPKHGIQRISAHEVIGRREISIIRNAKYVFVGGTNILSSTVNNFNRLIPEPGRRNLISPGFNKVVLVGAGWSAYSHSSNLYSKVYYNRILSWQYCQSVRDSYTFNKMKFFLGKTLNTSCPTTWNLDEQFENKFNPKYNKILFTLTDYSTDKLSDSNLLSAILNTDCNEIFFFPQGLKDLDYLCSLPIYKINKAKIKLLPYSYQEFESFVEHNSFNYIGTRLHAGIKCLQKNMPALIIGIDNRAIEIAKDINLSVCQRADMEAVRTWTSSSEGSRLQLPKKNINLWLKQFEDTKLPY